MALTQQSPVERGELWPQAIEIQVPVDLAQQMIGGNVILNSEPIEELFRGCLPSHRRLKLPAALAELNQTGSSRSSTEFFTSIDRYWRKNRSTGCCNCAARDG